jgi:hypothetical protein
MHFRVRRIGIFLFDTPAVAVVIANDCGRGVRTQSDDAEQRQKGGSYILHGFLSPSASNTPLPALFHFRPLSERSHS